MKTPAIIFGLAAALWWTPSLADARGGVRLDSVPVGDPGNPPDENGYGSVPYVFDITKKNVTNKMYVKFLNDVDPNGTNRRELFSPNMESSPLGGIIMNTGGDAGKKYQLKSQDFADVPVRFVNWADAARFMNWLSNGSQRGSSTEVGAYNLMKSQGKMIQRDPKSRFWVPSTDELYKAGYYKGDGTWLSQDPVTYAGMSQSIRRREDRTAIVLPVVNGRIFEIVDRVEDGVGNQTQVGYLLDSEGNRTIPFTFAGSANPDEESGDVGFYVASDPQKFREDDEDPDNVYFSGVPGGATLIAPSFPTGSGGGSGGGGNSFTGAPVINADLPPAS